MSNAFFGETQDEMERRVTIAVPGRVANSIAIELMEKMVLESTPEEPPSMFWLDGDDGEELWTNKAEWEEWFGGPLTLQEAMRLADIYSSEVVEKYRRQMVIATELGQHATKQLYELATELEKIPSYV